MAGSCHDQRVLDNSKIVTARRELFSGEEYLLADSAYTPTENIISAFKRPIRGKSTKNETRFNEALVNVRVKVEHCIGVLKSCFQSF